MFRIKLILAIICAGLFLFVLSIPLPTRLSNGEILDRGGLERLPDVDLRADAEAMAEKGDYGQAIEILTYIIDEGMGDSYAASQLRDEYMAELEKRDSRLGRLYRVGKGFVTGEVEDVPTLVGSTAGDFFLWGDIRTWLTSSLLRIKWTR